MVKDSNKSKGSIRNMKLLLKIVIDCSSQYKFSCSSPHGPGGLRRRISILPSEKISESLFHHLTAYVRDGARERDVFGAGFHAVLCVAALLDAAIAHERGQALVLHHLAGGMRVEQPHL